MAIAKKLNTEDLDAINELRAQFQELYNSLGILTIDEDVLTKQLENVKAEKSVKLQGFVQLRTSESQLMEKLKDQYGDGQIDLVEGTFTPDSTQE